MCCRYRIWFKRHNKILYAWIQKLISRSLTSRRPLDTENLKAHGHRALWFQGQLLKASFIIRLAALDRLARLCTFLDLLCIFYGLLLETRNLVFFDYPTTRNIWCAVLSMLLIPRGLRECKREFYWSSGLKKTKSIQTIATKLAFTCSIYLLWRERNFRIF